MALTRCRGERPLIHSSHSFSRSNLERKTATPSQGRGFLEPFVFVLPELGECLLQGFVARGNHPKVLDAFITERFDESSDADAAVAGVIL